MSDIAIKVENLHKLYRLGLKDETKDTLAATLFSWLKAPQKNFKQLRSLGHFDLNSNDPDVLHALNDVSFEVKHGEVLGIIGRNGAGKSTLLKVLSRITEPTAGRVTINGRVASLLEVGTGFHPELSGRENIYMNGTILGMTKKEIDRKFDEIVDFSGVEKFLDTPIKRYSSGMKVRLAFSVAAHLEPEILIIDEVLAVGDAAFQKKCLGKMQDVASHGRTVLFVSHQMEAVLGLCNRCILLAEGQIVASGAPNCVVDKYLQDFMAIINSDISKRSDRKGEGGIRFIDTWLENENGDRVCYVKSGETLKILAEFEIIEKEKAKNLSVSFAINSMKDVKVANLWNLLTGDFFEDIGQKKGVFECYIPKLQLNSGIYKYNLHISSSTVVEDWIIDAGIINVEKSDYYGFGRMPDSERLVLFDHSWKLRESLS
ncbi:ABC transporter ATP-binding protein [Geoalkalibacter sp.]|uniref:ABC transporter ATP-binding protein n=1 Tax=Geoalkalibacter sp. TaxID=3041440 RepID=UPI00272ECA9C|nr:ABC transporter ATP-binding protein [Geoalkalibacter sp.]